MRLEREAEAAGEKRPGSGEGGPAVQAPGPAGERLRGGPPSLRPRPALPAPRRAASLLPSAEAELRAESLLEEARSPFQPRRRGKEEPRLASRNWERRLGFLRGRFSFSPTIRSSLPDFQGLQRGFQREASRREVKEPPPCRPFRLRTSSRPCRHPQDFQQTPVQRSRSWTCLSSLSSNTLPVHITDAVRRRESAIKLSQDDKQYKENEGVRWAELQRKKSQAMQRSVNSRAKAMDPHRSLEETTKEKLRQHRQNNQRKTKEYEKELEEMKRRVKNRPYLFEEATKGQSGGTKAFPGHFAAVWTE